MVNRPPRRANGVNRWKPNQRRPRRRGRRWRRRRGGAAHRVTPVGGCGVRVHLVLTRNNLWGQLYRKGRLVQQWSAGQTRDARGSKRRKIQAATQLGDWVAAAGRRALVSGRRRRRRRPRRSRPRQMLHRARKFRFWRHRWRLIGRLTRSVRLVVRLVGWSRSRRWRVVLAGLWRTTSRTTRRYRLEARPVRSHNGLRPSREKRV